MFIRIILLQMDQYLFVDRDRFCIFAFKLEHVGQNLETGEIIFVFITAIQPCGLHILSGCLFGGIKLICVDH